jgi:hypothetical protein
VVALAAALVQGCGTPSAHTISRNYGLRGDIPVDPPWPRTAAEDDCVTGGRLYKQYCGSCHNARPLGERPFANYEVAIAHMRDQAYLTGKEYRQIIQFLRRWDNIGPPTPAVEPSPKRLIFSQPISEPGQNSSPPPPPGPPAGGGAWQKPSAPPVGAAVPGAPGALPPAIN